MGIIFMIKRRRTIVAIVALALGVGIASAVSMALTGHTLDTIFAGLSLIVSEAIFVAAIAAAVYAKPAYDEAVARMRPPLLHIQEFGIYSVDDSRLSPDRQSERSQRIRAVRPPRILSTCPV